MTTDAIGTSACVVLCTEHGPTRSDWNHVIERLQSRGVKVLAAPIPLTSLADDVAALERALERTDGPVLARRACLRRRCNRGEYQPKSPRAGLHCSPRAR